MTTGFEQDEELVYVSAPCCSSQFGIKLYVLHERLEQLIKKLRRVQLVQIGMMQSHCAENRLNQGSAKGDKIGHPRLHSC